MKVKDAKLITGSMTRTSKMPGLSYSLPAWECKTGSKLRKVKTSPCYGCYALKGNYTRYPAIREAQYRRLEAINHPDWVTAMAAVIKPLMSNQPAPWLMYIAGALFALILTSINVPALAFALGMYLPLELNTPILVGGLIAHFVSTRSKDEGLNRARKDRGILIASGFIAGGALMGVISVILKSLGADWKLHAWSETHGAELLGLAMFILLCGYMIWDSMRAKKE